MNIKLKKILISLYLFLFLIFPVIAQTHSSVNLESDVYYILEQAEMRGLCSPLSGVRPYTRSVVIGKINEILASQKADKLKRTELDILEQYLEKFDKPKTGIDWKRGAYYAETTIGKNDDPLSINIGMTADIEGSSGMYSSFTDNYFGTETWISLYANGDIGNHVSWELIGNGGLVQTPRKYLGKYDTYYEGFINNGSYKNDPIDVFSEPLTHFPYSYRKRWNGSVHFFNNLSSYDTWPDDLAGCYSLPSELTASFLENKLIIRLGRILREWGSTSFGSSLAFNQMARPFLGFEAEFNPVSWFSFASLTGALEYYNSSGIKNSRRHSKICFP